MCARAVIDRYPADAFGYSREEVAALVLGGRGTKPEERLKVVRAILEAVRDQDEPNAVPGIDRARLDEALAWLGDKAQSM
jgi:hypothetical protein